MRVRERGGRKKGHQKKVPAQTLGGFTVRIEKQPPTTGVRFFKKFTRHRGGSFLFRAKSVQRRQFRKPYGTGSRLGPSQKGKSTLKVRVDSHGGELLRKKIFCTVDPTKSGGGVQCKAG